MRVISVLYLFKAVSTSSSAEFKELLRSALSSPSSESEEIVVSGDGSLSLLRFIAVTRLVPE